jgi:Flp pilus assembly pilin Flp
MSRARAGAAALRRETGAAAVEYAGVLLLVGLLFVGLFRIGLPGEVAKWAGKVVAVVDAGDTGGGTPGTAQGT